ncbi:hypothetical protein V2J09_023943 [Rumex salicifolius]
MEFATESVEGVRFGFMSDEEVRSLSFKKIISPLVLDPVGGPISGGLYDPALGPMDESVICKTCGQRYYNCPGHFGHIDLVSVVYNPLLFNTLVNILRKTCFFCLHFTSSRQEVNKCLMKLKLIVKGDIVGAKNLDAKELYLKMNDHPEDTNDNSYSGHKCSENSGNQEWTSLQLNEARSVLREFLKFHSKKCENCKGKNPKLKKPTFGWIHMSGMSDASIRANVIQGTSAKINFNGSDDDKSISEVDNNEDPVYGGVVSSGETSTISTQDNKSKKKKKKTDVQMEFLEQQKAFAGSMLPSTVRDVLKGLWENEAELCSFICNIQHQAHTKPQKTGYYIFFLKRLPVPPIKFRPPAKQADSMMEHPQTVLLGKIVEANIALGNAREQGVEHKAILFRWMSLQQSINVYFDTKTAVGQSQRSSGTGICQLLEKKEGVFRQKMMGKRVNYACRSVISPDPYLAVNEIGIPPAFALKLTYPERVTPWNVMKLRDAVINGPENHPGATTYIDKLTSIKLLGKKNSRITIARKLSSSRGAVTEAGKNSDYDFEGKIVLRHIRDGDAVLANRQPTLHKPSICGFKVRVLPGEKTIRMHYVNCDSFNADFDGDEINVHLPQDEVSRAEAYNIVNADYQYIVPTRGDPKRALIQDHIVSAVLLTKRDTFLTGDVFNQLLYSSGLTSGARNDNVKAGRKVTIIDSEDFVSSLPPAILKPQPLWTGKQVVTAILNHITQGEPFTVKKRGKIAREYFGKDDSKRKDDQSLINREPTESIDEDVVFVYKNELVQGVIDKEQFGKYGLVHTVQELFGSNVAGTLLSVLSRVLTTYTQFHGFTCGVDDLLLFQDYETQRKKLLEVCQSCGEEVHMQFVGCGEEKPIDSTDIQIEIEKAILHNGDSAIAKLDGMMRNKLNSCSSAVGKLFPSCLIKPFRRNCLSQMTLSGAKGGTFNFQQISLLLGQQELEGKRVPRMVSGKTLPCFPPWDTSSRAGGFIGDRYLSGLRPQEFYFHCMAGREGLVDTAVKTSRSGYLQRCLIKNLESLRVHYDYTVRDADGSIVQFYYGEDGVDVHKKNFIQEFEALALNRKIVKNSIFGKSDDQCISKYLEDNQFPGELAKKVEDFLMDEKKTKRCGIGRKKERKSFMKLVQGKFFLSLAEPGEPVGVIAAQSIGEPSTQMTLNTFHHAGRGEMNVTLGIPRLQEIIMTASSIIRTPTMTCPLLRDKSSDDAERLAATMRKVCVADLVENIEVCVVPLTVEKSDVYTLCKLRMKLYRPESYPPHTDISLEDCKETLENLFMRELEDAIERHMQLIFKINDIVHFTSDSSTGASDDAGDDNDNGGSKSQRNDAGSDDDDDANEEGADDLGLDVKKNKRQATDEMDYEDSSDNEVQEGMPIDENDSDSDESEHEEQEKEKDHISATATNEKEKDNEVQEGMPIDENDSDSDESAHEEQEKEKGDIPATPTKAVDEKTPSPAKSRSTPEKVKPSANQKKPKSKKNKNDRAVYLECDGQNFEAHFQFSIKDPHIMLTQIVERTAKKVSIKNPGEIEQCKVVDIHLDDSGNSKSGGIPMLREGKESRKALQTAGVNFSAFWDLQDDLDINFISSNSVDPILRTYGIEAARATIITEIYRVFNHYGVSVDMRHLMLVADFMTHTGEYRAMNRMGGIAESTSPFSRMCFETASKFIVEAATRSEKDDLETPSARVCLGLPAKVGTGCFDLLHDIAL